jgi:hypothetical protein
VTIKQAKTSRGSYASPVVGRLGGRQVRTIDEPCAGGGQSNTLECHLCEPALRYEAIERGRFRQEAGSECDAATSQVRLRSVEVGSGRSELLLT